MRSLCKPLQSIRYYNRVRLFITSPPDARVCSTGVLAASAPGKVSQHSAQRQPTSSICASNLSKNRDPSIYALSTAAGRAAIAIIRVSGPACLPVYQSLCPSTQPLKPRHATLRTLYAPNEPGKEAQVLDSGALVLYFPSPETVTGEDILELHVHGGTAVVKAVLAAIPRAVSKRSSQSIRYAEPGEFTRRAFYNNRLDLLQIETLGDTLAAETEQQRRLAVRGASSVLAERYESWRQKLLYTRGELEALIDFAEDQSFDESPASLCDSVAKQVRELRSKLQMNIVNGSRGELLRHGIRMALVGEPNAGKSSLLNEIVGRQAAIVNSEPGTTRDVIDVNLDIGGFFCTIADLAGLRKESPNSHATQIGEIEKEGMRRAEEIALTADVVIAVFPMVESIQNSQSHQVKPAIDSQVLEVLKRCNRKTQRIVFVLNKADILPDQKSLINQCWDFQQHPAVQGIALPEIIVYAVSCKDAQTKSSSKPDPGGIQALLDGLIQLFSRMTSAIDVDGQQVASDHSAWAEMLGATERQRILLEQCLQHLEGFLAVTQPSREPYAQASRAEDDIDVVVAAESLRAAADCLAKITGRGEAGDVEEVLGVVFEKYGHQCGNAYVASRMLTWK